MAKELIVVIDDEIDTIDLLQAALERRGYEVKGFTDGERGLRFVQERPPALLLLDLMMPHISGYEVCRQLRADPKTADVPIVVLSASGTAVAEADAMEAGANQFVLKPISIKTLASLVESVLQPNL